MRFAVWRKGKAEARAHAVAAKAAPEPVRKVVAAAEPAAGDLDLRSLGQALARRRGWIIVPTVLVAVGAITAVNLVTPRYKSEARILVEGRENVFLRPSGERSEERTTLDAEAVTSQVQLVLSRDLAQEVVRKNKLAEQAEFDPLLQPISPLKSLLSLFGVGRDPFQMTAEERVLDAFYERLTAYAVDKSRVIVVEFQSRDPELAARVANSIADGYLVLQQNARQEQARSASLWLSGEIENLRRKVADAESRVEEFRSKSSLFVGTNNTTLSNQQMGELNTQLNNARALRSDAESKAGLIREMLQSGKPIDASEVLNSELMRRLSEQRVTLRAQLAEQSSTLLDNHPRIKELKAQLADLDHQIRDEAGKISRSLDSDARIAGGRVEGLTASLEQMKKLASSSNGQDVQLRALEREAKAQRDLLESYLAKYREANTRENIDAAPSEGRIISRAIVSNTPAYPKRLPVVLIATLATMLLSAGVIVTGELLRITAPRAAAVLTAAPVRRVPKGKPAAAVEAVPVDAGALDGGAAHALAVDAAVVKAAAVEPAPVAPPRIPQPATTLDEIEQLAADLCAAGNAARKIVMLGTAPGEIITLTALTLARLMARDTRVAVVDLAGFASTISAVSVDQSAPGLAEVIKGEASFSEIITKDRLSRVHLVSAGRPGFDRSLLQSPRLALALDALLRVYDHVLLDAGAASDLPAELLTANARAVVVPDPSLDAGVRSQMCEKLRAVGFSEVTMLSKPAQPAKAIDSEPAAHGVAA